MTTSVSPYSIPAQPQELPNTDPESVRVLQDALENIDLPASQGGIKHGNKEEPQSIEKLLRTIVNSLGLGSLLPDFGSLRRVNPGLGNGEANIDALKREPMPLADIRTLQREPSIMNMLPLDKVKLSSEQTVD
ncbi:MAG: hypothetical protein AAF621_06440 [Pseudomonadota bacterium]